MHLKFAFILVLSSFVKADDHGVLCSSQMNAWMQTTQAEAIVNSLTGKSVCEVQEYGNRVYDSFVHLGRGSHHYAGYPMKDSGLNPSCTGFMAGAVPAGGCAFSYPVFTHSTCRVIVNTTHELQWCQTNINATIRIALTKNITSLSTEADSDQNPYPSSFCYEESPYRDVLSDDILYVGQLMVNMSKGEAVQQLPGTADASVLFRTFASTKLNFINCESETELDTVKERLLWISIVLTSACVALLLLLLAFTATACFCLLGNTRISAT